MKKFTTLALALMVAFITGNFNSVKAQLNPGDIVITEIMYNNPGIDTLEFFEVYNRTGSDINLDGFVIGYSWASYAGSGPALRDTLPAIILPAGGRVVFAKNGAAFQAVFGQAPDYVYSGLGSGLSNTSGRIYIVDTTGPGETIIDSVHYADAAPWPTAADGTGPSLVLCDENANNDDPANWTVATTQVGNTNIYAHPWGDCPPGPKVTDVKVVSDTKLLVFFDVMVDITAENTANYSLVSGTPIASAVRTASFKEVVLTLGSPLVAGDADTLIVSGVQDSATGTPMPGPDSTKIVYNGANGPSVVNVSILSGTSLEVTFDMMVDITAENPANYSLASGIAITSAVRNATFDKVTLTLASSLTGKDTLTVQNVQDSLTGTPMSPPQNFELIYNTLTTGLVITEIMYRGKAGLGDTLEFFEFYNNTSSPINLQGITTVGVNYTFPDTTIPAGEYWILAKNKSAIMTVFNPNTTVLEWNSGALSNSGETIAFINTVGDTIDKVQYGRNAPWPVLPAPGYSIVLCDVNADNNDPSNWSIAADTIVYQSDSFFTSPGAPNTCITVNVSSSIEAAGISIYPNPVENTLNVTSNVPIKNISIYNIQGQLVRYDNDNNVDVSNLSKGIYIVKVLLQNGEMHTAKILKE